MIFVSCLIDWINDENNIKNSAMYTILLNYTHKYFHDQHYNAKVIY